MLRTLREINSLFLCLLALNAIILTSAYADTGAQAKDDDSNGSGTPASTTSGATESASSAVAQPTTSSGNSATQSGSAAPAGAASDATTAGASTPAASQGSASRTPMQAGVQKVELSLETLRDVGLDLKHLLKGASSLYDEVTIQPVRLITEPEVIGNGIIINLPIGTQPVGPPQPARKDRVDMAMNTIRPIVDLLKKMWTSSWTGTSNLTCRLQCSKNCNPKQKHG